MTLLQSEIKNDLSLVLSSIQRDDRPVASPLEALKISTIFPVLMLTSNILCWLVAYMVFVLEGDNTGLGVKFYAEAAMLFMGYGGWISLAVTFFIGFFFTLIFFPTSLMYVAIPREVRRESKITRHIISNLKKVSFCLWVLAAILASVGVMTGKFMLLYSFPALMFLAIFMFNGYIGIETVRYGLGPLVKKVSGYRK